MSLEIAVEDISARDPYRSHRVRIGNFYADLTRAEFSDLAVACNTARENELCVFCKVPRSQCKSRPLPAPPGETP